jgi:hypothetical protein
MTQSSFPIGLGHVEPRKGAGGVRYRAKVPTGHGGHRTVGTYDTREEAESVLRGLVEKRAAGQLIFGGETLRQYGERFLARRAERDIRNIKTDRFRWTVHVLAAHFADWPLAGIKPPDVAR